MSLADEFRKRAEAIRTEYHKWFVPGMSVDGLKRAEILEEIAEVVELWETDTTEKQP